MTPFAQGGYAWMPLGFQYSSAVMALPGFRIERARFARPVPLAEGFSRIQSFLASKRRSPHALCACELRSPEPMDEATFVAFNRSYIEPLRAWGVLQGDLNPVARCNLCPPAGEIDVPSIYAFSYTMPSDEALPSFITSGAAECPDRPNYRENIVRIGETTPDALRDKLRFALGDIEARLDIMKLGWSDVLDARLYTVHDLHFAFDEFASRRALGGGLNWHPVRPPVVDIEIEIDVRAVRSEIILPI